jgi:2-(1,2-epoxy-1,2-dihydrophenyl)acetyl-CoA isomerase
VELTTIRFEVADGVGLLTFDRPDRANAMNLRMMKELGQVAQRCEEDAAIRAVLVTGSGRFFSAGGDLSAFDAAADMAAFLEEMTGHLHTAIARFARMDPPVIAAVNGVAAGAGLSFALACDLAMAAESALFASAYTSSGLTPDGSSTFFLPRIVGVRRAAELLLTNRKLDAQEALAWGIVSQVVPDDDLFDAAWAMARKLADGPTVAFGRTKALLLASTGDALERQLALEAEAIVSMTKTHDGAEGVGAFLEKRRPRFEGR